MGDLWVSIDGWVGGWMRRWLVVVSGLESRL